jgi:hypothetical protein
LTARRGEIDAALGVQNYWHGNAAMYGDTLRAGQINADEATLSAERDSIDRRLAQIDGELKTA